MATISYSNLYKILTEFRGWLKTNSIKADGGEVFSRTFEILKTCAELQKSDRLPELLSHVNKDDVYSAIAQGMEYEGLYLCCKELALCGEIKRKIKQTLFGPLHTRDENSSTNEGRNLLFEFTFCNRLKLAGLDAVPKEDIELVINSSIYAIECKRIYSLQKINARFYEAIDKIKEQKSKQPRLFGMIALKLDKVFRIDKSKPLSVFDVKAAKFEAERMLNTVQSTYVRRWSRQLTTDQIPVVAIILETDFLIIPTETGPISTVNYHYITVPSHIQIAKNRHTRNLSIMEKALGVISNLL